MRVKWLPFAIALCPMAAEAGQDSPKTTAAIERHFTSNALDSADAVADWYTLLRGSMQHGWRGEDSSLKLGAEFQATRFDTISIEDDRAIAFSAEAWKRLDESIELRGTLTYSASSEGDDLQLGPFTLGTRTLKQVFGVQTQVGVDLGNSTALVVDLASGTERVGKSRFSGLPIEPAKLDPDRDRIHAGAKIVRTSGTFAYGAAASATRVKVEPLGFPPVGLSFSEYTLRAEAGWQAPDGTTITGWLGAQTLRGAFDIFSDTRPAYQLSAVKIFANGVELRGAVFARFETSDSDDPLSSWLKRGEFEIKIPVREKLVFASGAFAEVKENLLLENEERKHGVYAEATYDWTKQLALVVRLDFSRSLATIVDVRKETLDAFVGLRTRI